MEFDEDAADTRCNIFADWKATVKRKRRNPNFNQTLETLRAHFFDLAASSEVAGGVLATKYGAGAVLVATHATEAAAAYAARPGAMVVGEVGLLVDRGYQKFIKTSQFEIPATASQLHAIHQFTEELKQLTGSIDLYNESLGTTSDLHQYDRLKGREEMQAEARRPWKPAGGE